jgi:hypothetical protein
LQLIPVLIQKDTSGDSKEQVERLDSGTQVTFINVNPGQKSAPSSVEDGDVMQPFNERETMDGNKQEDDQEVLNVNPGQVSAQSVDDGAVMKPFNERETMDGYKNEEEQLGSTGQNILRKGTQNTYAKGVENHIPEGHCKEVEGSKLAKRDSKHHNCDMEPGALSLKDTMLSGPNLPESQPGIGAQARGQMPETAILGLVWDPGLEIKPEDADPLGIIAPWLLQSRPLFHRLSDWKGMGYHCSSWKRWTHEDC